MLRVGLTGGLASGKSFVGRNLAEFGCHVICNDEMGHAVMQPGAEAYDGIVKEFGVEILNTDGTIDRRKLAAIVFRDPDKLAALNALVHPPVRERTRAELDVFEKTHPDGVAIIEAAIMIETGSFRDYGKLIVAACSTEQQMERALHREGSRDGMTRQQVVERLNRQMPLAEKVQYADFVIDTSGSKESTIAQTKAVYEALIRLESAKTKTLH